MEHSQVAEYLAHLAGQDRAERTIDEYGKVLDDLLEHLNWGDGSLSRVTTPQIEGYVASLQERGLATKTVRFRLFTIKGFFEFLVEKGYLRRSPAEPISPPELGPRLPQVLTKSQVKALFEAIGKDSPTARRDRALFYLIYSCGLRAGEAVEIRVKDLDLTKGALRVRGNRARELPLHSAVLRVLEGYLADSGPEGYLFPGRGGSRLTLRNVELRLKRYLEKAGLPEQVTPRTLRHSLAYHLLQDGKSLRRVQKLLGSESLERPAVYTKLLDETPEEIVAEVSPRRSIESKEEGGWQREEIVTAN